MSTLGSYLRTAREAKGIDLRQAAQETRINFNYLKAIEEDDFSRLPGEVFVKGFLKNYAKFLHLSEDEIMKRLAETVAPQPAATSAGATPGKPSKAQKVEPKKTPTADVHQNAPPDKQPKRIGLEPFLWGGAVVIGLVVFVLTALPSKKQKIGHTPVVATQGSSTTGIVAAPTSTAIAEKLYLDIYALEDAWVLVRTDTSPQKKATLKKGESVTWSADERFLLSYSSVGAVKLVLNGKELFVSGPKSAVVRDLIVTHAGIALQKVETDQTKQRKPKPATQATTTALPRTTQTASAPPALAAPTTPSAAPAQPAPPATSKPSATPQQVAPIFMTPQER